MKKWTCMILALLLVFTAAAPAFAAQTAHRQAAMRYTAEKAPAMGPKAESTVYPGPNSTLYYDQLGEIARVIYDNLLAHAYEMTDGKTIIVFEFPANIGINSITLADYSDALSAFSRDHSEIFWIDFSSLNLNIAALPTEGSKVIAKFSAVEDTYLITPLKSADDVLAARKAMDAGIKAALASVDRTKSVYDQLLSIHDWLCSHNEYNHTTLNTDRRTYTALSALDQDASTMPVCEGYARAFKLLCDALGVPCVTVNGDGIQDGYAEPHMWNAVRLDGAWYAVDVTWDDALGDDVYFLVGSGTYGNGATFAQSHVSDPQINPNGRDFYYPTLASAAYDPAASKPQSVDGYEPLPGFTASNVYADGMFSDVKAGDWFRDNVAQAYALGLMVGNGDGTFNANGSVTIAETISIAARLHAAYTGGTIPKSEEIWYAGSVRYALDNGIILSEYKNYNTPILRGEFAVILSRALPQQALEKINDIPDGRIPDVAQGDEIYMLYRAGVLRGDVDGSYHPDTAIRRCEVAAIVTRMAVPGLRVAFAL